MGLFSRKAAPVSYMPTTRDIDKASKRQAKESAASDRRRAAHRKAVFRQGDASGTPFKKRGIFG